MSDYEQKVQNQILANLERGSCTIPELCSHIPYHMIMVKRQLESLAAQGKVVAHPCNEGAAQIVALAN